jgi:nucleotide-binding universal stress UspA family protein
LPVADRYTAIFHCNSNLYLPNVSPNISSSQIHPVESRLEAFCDEFSAELPNCPFVIEKTIVESDQPVDQIIQHAEKYDYDLVVMGSRGLGMLANVMLGSTSRRVLRRCRKPVLVIRLPEEVEK